ncbi:PucR family transcriptional regulator [Gorillibacterium sp. sgz5001074]|uniref:PucR family transcriptional regulator n=1 Tax=Gorillibacterium sp. sgz5001074 TaxID=3446695 RepID=UPI003F67705C
MHFTVEQALSVYPLSEGKLIAGSSGLKRVVRAINVMDAPDIADWIKEGEMVFTTAYLFKDRPQDALELIRKLARRRSAGLGIKLGRFWQEVPAEVAELADRLEFPVIALPYAFTFSDQMNGLFHAEMKRATGAMQDVMEKQVRLMRFALQSEHSSALLFDKVSEVVGVRMAVVTSGGRLIYKGVDLDEGELLQGWPWSAVQSRFRFGGGQALRVPLHRREQCAGFAVFLHPGAYLNAPEEGLYVQAAELIAFHLNRHEEDPFLQSAFKDMALLIRRHLKGGLPADALEDYGGKNGVELLGNPYRCILTDVPHDPAGPRGRMEKLERVKLELAALPTLKERGGIHTVLEEGVLSLLPDDPAEGEGRLEELLRMGLSGLGKSSPTAGCRSAVSVRKQGVGGLKEAFRECGETLRLSREWGIGDRVVSFGQLDLALVFEQVPRERMEIYCTRWLGRLLEEKPDYAQEMLRTLETYLDCDGQLNETAKRLFIHRNTVTYRIDKLGELLQVDFKKVGDLMRLKLAFLFRRMLIGGSEGADRAV